MEIYTLIQEESIYHKAYEVISVKMSINIYIPLILSLLTGCSKDICTVGDLHISERDIDQRARVSEIYYPGSGKEYVALAQLIKGYLSLEILKSFNYKTDDIVLEGEAKRIDGNTKAPSVLKKIKDVYGRDNAGYLRTFAQVVYGERVLYNEIFLKSEEINKEQLFRADTFLKEAMRSSKSFKEIAKRYEMSVKSLKISSKGIMPYGNEIKTVQSISGVEHAKRLSDAVSKIKQGEIYPETIEWLEGYQVIRFVKKDGEDFVIETVNIFKVNYDEWFWDRASKIPVKIYDKTLKDELLKEVTWARNLRLD